MTTPDLTFFEPTTEPDPWRHARRILREHAPASILPGDWPVRQRPSDPGPCVDLRPWRLPR